jgi:4'-phosphopantetheinyl transferase
MTALRWEHATEPPALAGGEVHVFLAAVNTLPAEALAAWLSDDERGRAERFHFARDRQCFVGTRGLLRGLLGRYLGVEPAALRFAYGPRGKPSLVAEGEAGRMRFNVSHSGGLALLAFAWDRDLGVDIERERLVPEYESIARSHFSPRERAALEGLAPAERPRAFFRCWTRKEAFIKATGDGLSFPLDEFEVTLAPGEPARLLRIEGDEKEARRWWLEDLEPAAGFAGALAVKGRPSRLACWMWPDSLERSYGPRRERRQDDLQGGRESRGAVLDLAR